MHVLHQHNATLTPHREGRFHHFDLPANVTHAVLQSRRFRPAHLLAESTDHRELGVAVARLTLDDTAIDLASLPAASGSRRTRSR